MATTTGDVWTFTVESHREGSTIVTRLPGYNSDWTWDPVTETWTTTDMELLAAGGGRYKNRFVAIGHNVIYFGDI